MDPVQISTTDVDINALINIKSLNMIIPFYHIKYDYANEINR